MRYLYLLSLLLVTVMVYGQHLHVPQERPQPRPRICMYPEAGKFPLEPGWLLTTDVSTLIQPEAGPTFGAEYRIDLHWAVALDVTALLYNMPDFYSFESQHMGFRVLPQVKYYFPGRKHSYRGYVSAQGMYKQVTYHITDMLGRDWNGSQYDYYESIRYRESKSVWAASGNIGFQKFVGKERRMMLEMFAGLGFRYKSFKQANIPAGAAIQTNRWNEMNPFEDDGLYPHIAMGFKIGYRL